MPNSIREESVTDPQTSNFNSQWQRQVRIGLGKVVDTFETEAEEAKELALVAGEVGDLGLVFGGDLFSSPSHGGRFAACPFCWVLRHCAMCCFSRSVNYVGDTQIFARVGAQGNQVLIYRMTFEAKEDLAMILPLPVRQGTGDGGIQFVNLEKYPEIFRDLESGFPAPLTFGAPTGSLRTKDARRQLAVESVGSFEASFVPSMADFDRLDPRFRIETKTWAQIPAYVNYGFAVFKLKAGTQRQEVHPMALAFPTADRSRVFFPTVHIHDGKVHSKETFDHSLYCQTASSEVKMTWQESTRQARQFTSIERSQGMIRPDEHVYKTSLVGKLDNTDTWIGAV